MEIESMTIKYDLDKLGVTDAVQKLLEAGYSVASLRFGSRTPIGPGDLADNATAEAAWKKCREAAGNRDGMYTDRVYFLSGFEAAVQAMKETEHADDPVEVAWKVYCDNLQLFRDASGSADKFPAHFNAFKAGYYNGIAAEQERWESQYAKTPNST